MSDRRKDLPPANSSQFLQQVREAVSTYLGTRGDKLDRGVTVRDLVDAGLVELNANYVSGTGKTPIKGPGSGLGGGSTVIVVPGEPGGGGDEPDLTPPPTPGGVTVTALFNNLLIQTDPTTYTQGHGHARTQVFGATWTSGSKPTFANAVLIAEYLGNVYAHPTTLGTEWHIWLKWVTNDGVVSAAPAGGTNGFVATTGKVGTSDLGTAIVLAQNLAPSSVTADKALLDIGGGNLVGNSSFELDSNGDGVPDLWNLYDGTGGGSLSRVPGRITGFAVRYTTTVAFDTWARGISGGGPGIVWKPDKTYVVSFYARAPAGSGFLGRTLSPQWNQWPTVTELRNFPLTESWQRYAWRLTWGASVEPAGPLYLSCSGGTPVGSFEFDDVQTEEGDTLTGYSGKLAANTIVAGDGSIANLAITNALIANLAVDDAKVANLSVAKLLAGILTIGQYIRSSDFIAGVQGWQLVSGGTCQFPAAFIIGQLTASQINARGLVIRRASDNAVVLDAGSNTPIPGGMVDPAANWLNTNVLLSADGKLLNQGSQQGQVTVSGLGLRTFTVSAFGYQSPSARLGTGIWSDGANVSSEGAWWNFRWINRNNAALDIYRRWHPGDAQAVADDIANLIAANDRNWIVVVWTNDHPTGNMPPANLLEAMYTLGASRAVLGGPSFFNTYRAAYILVGACRSPEGSGLELASTTQQGAIELTFHLQGGQLLGSTPRGVVTVRDQGYAGDLDATRGATWGANLNAVPTNLAALSGNEDIRNALLGPAIESAAKTANWSSVNAKPAFGTFALLDQLTQANASTYIAAAALGLAHINTATITNLAALSTYTGTLTVDTGGFIRGGKSDYGDATAGFFLGWSGGSHKFHLGTNTNYLRWNPTSGLELKLESFTCNVAMPSGISGPTGSYGYATAVATVTGGGGVAPFTYAWTVSKDTYYPNLGTNEVWISSGQGTNQINIEGRCTNNNRNDVTVTCVITDANGRTATSGAYMEATHGAFVP